MCHKCQGARTVVQLAGDRKCVSYKKSQDWRAAWKFLSQLVPDLPHSYIHLSLDTCKPPVPILKTVLRKYTVSHALRSAGIEEMRVCRVDRAPGTPSFTWGHTGSMTWQHAHLQGTQHIPSCGALAWMGQFALSSDFACASPSYFLCDWGTSWDKKLSPELSQHSQWHLEVENISQIFMRYVSIFQITVFP